MTTPSRVSLTDLPLEVTDYVIHYLTPKDLCNFSRVDKLIYTMTTSDRKWFFILKLNINFKMMTEKRKFISADLTQLLGLWNEWLATRWDVNNIQRFRPQLLINNKRKKDLYGVLDKICTPVANFAYQSYQGNNSTYLIQYFIVLSWFVSLPQFYWFDLEPSRT